MAADRIEKKVQLDAPAARVWRALTDHREFGEWFGVKFSGPFVPGQATRGQLTLAGYEHVALEVEVVQMEAERLFSFRWHPYAVDPEVDYSKEPRTLVEFRLEQIATGTELRVTESGFDQLPAGRRRLDAFRMNEGGWASQLVRIGNYVRQGR